MPRASRNGVGSNQYQTRVGRGSPAPRSVLADIETAAQADEPDAESVAWAFSGSPEQRRQETLEQVKEDLYGVLMQGELRLNRVLVRKHEPRSDETHLHMVTLLVDVPPTSPPSFFGEKQVVFEFELNDQRKEFAYLPDMPPDLKRGAEVATAMSLLVNSSFEDDQENDEDERWAKWSSRQDWEVGLYHCEEDTGFTSTYLRVAPVEVWSRGRTESRRKRSKSAAGSGPPVDVTENWWAVNPDR